MGFAGDSQVRGTNIMRTVMPSAVWGPQLAFVKNTDISDDNVLGILNLADGYLNGISQKSFRQAK